MVLEFGAVSMEAWTNDEPEPAPVGWVPEVEDTCASIVAVT